MKAYRRQYRSGGEETAKINGEKAGWRRGRKLAGGSAAAAQSGAYRPAENCAASPGNEISMQHGENNQLRRRRMWLSASAAKAIMLA